MNASSESKLAAYRRRKEAAGSPFPQPPNQSSKPIATDEAELSTDSDHSPLRLGPTSVPTSPSGPNPYNLISTSSDPVGRVNNSEFATQAMQKDDRINDPRVLALSTMYLLQTEQSVRISVQTAEQSQFLSHILLPYVKGCERFMKSAMKECESLKLRLVASRQKLHAEEAQRAALGKDADQPHLAASVEADGSKSSHELRSLVGVLQQQLKDQRQRFDQELARVNQRREREVHIIQEQSEKQIKCLEQQVELLKRSNNENLRSSSRIQEDLREVERVLPREYVSLSINTQDVAMSTVRRASRSHSPQVQQQLVLVPKMLSASSPCPSSNPRHSTVVASMNGSSWRSIYLVVSPQGVCSYGESISDPATPLFTLNEVTSLKLGSSKHVQRPLLLSVSYANKRHIDIALSDKSEREFWRQAFKIKRTEEPPNKRNETLATPHADSVASTPSLSSANPVIAEAESPSLKRWLEAQADNVRRGDLDPDNTSLNNNEINTPDGESGSETAEKKKSVPSSPLPQRPPLATGARDGAITTMSTSSRDRLPPLAPLSKRRSTISGSASTADSLTEDDTGDYGPRRAMISHTDDPIAPVSPSHSSDSGASPPSSEESIQLSPELSPVVAFNGPHDDVLATNERRK